MDPSRDLHDQVADDLPAFALGILDAAAAERAQRHLASCAACGIEAERLRDTATTIAFASSAASPSARARERLFQRIAGEGDPGTPGVATRASRQGPDLWRVVAALAALLVVLLLGANVKLRRDLELERKNLATASASSIANRELARLLWDPESAKQLMSAGTPGLKVGYIYTRPDTGMAVLVTQGLPLLPPDKRYQVWLVRPDGSRGSGGMFTVDANGNGQLVIRAPAPFAEYTAIGITVEPWAGSSGPTTPRVAGAEVH